MCLRPISLAVAVGFLFCSSTVWAQSAPADSGGKPHADPTTSAPAKDKDRNEDEKPATEGVLEKPSVTDHEIMLAGQALKYRATAAKMLMKDEDGKAKATIFFVAYEKDRPAAVSASDRPITFVFNGGPGAAAVWLHLGTAGPKRIALNEIGEPPAPPYALTDNPNTWLDITDLVFIDPVGTGFSRAAQGEKPEQFYGVKEDIRSVADFIRLYTTHYQRWLSPKFLAGESYGTTRAAGLSEYLLDSSGIALNGVVLISSVLNFEILAFGDGNDLPYPLYLPSYTAIAWYHRKLPANLQADLRATLVKAEAFSRDYAAALREGSRLSAVRRKQIVQQLAEFTGLPAAFIDKADLRVNPSQFRKQLLAGERRVLGGFDARITGYDLDAAADAPEYDPSLSRYLPVYMGTFNEYVRRGLKYESDLPYEVLSRRVQPWKFGEPGSGYLYVADNLRSAMAKNPHMKVFFASGQFDLATPYFSTDYTIDHLNLSPDLQENITHRYYPGGHMMYHHQPSQAKLHEDIMVFMGAALATTAR